jgi:hypothetical protein
MNQQEYLLICLAEEAAEMIQVVGKAQRFGLGDDFLEESPKEALIREYNDLLGAMELLIDHTTDGDKKVFSYWTSRDMIDAKKRKIIKYMEYSEGKGTLS